MINQEREREAKERESEGAATVLAKDTSSLAFHGTQNLKNYRRWYLIKLITK